VRCEDKSDEARLGIDGAIEGTTRTASCTGWPAGARPPERPPATYPDGRRVWFIEGEKVRED
jgi:hypothetical protein